MFRGNGFVAAEDLNTKGKAEVGNKNDLENDHGHCKVATAVAGVL